MEMETSNICSNEQSKDIENIDFSLIDIIEDCIEIRVFKNTSLEKINSLKGEENTVQSVNSGTIGKIIDIHDKGGETDVVIQWNNGKGKVIFDLDTNEVMLMAEFV